MFPINDLFDYQPELTEPAEECAGPNPHWQGMFVIDKDDLYPKGFSPLELNNVGSVPKHKLIISQEIPWQFYQKTTY